MLNQAAIEPILTQVNEALGHTIIYGEQRGNFAVAQQLADQALEEARTIDNPQLLAAALLMRAKVHILQGDCAAAIALAQQVPQLVPTLVNDCLPALAYEILATYQQFNLFPDGAGAGAIELEDRWNGVAYLTPIDPVFQSLFAQATDPTAQYEAGMAYQFACRLLSVKYVLSHAQQTAGHQPSESMISAFLPMLNLLWQSGQQSGDEGPMALAELTRAGLYYQVGDRQAAQQHLDNARDRYQRLGDAIGLANTYRLQGDWLVGGLNTPLVWNFAIQDSNVEGSQQPWHVEAQEFRPGSDQAAAWAMYDQAEELYEQAAAPRGLAALLVCRGYLSAANDDYATALTRIEQAANLFETCDDRLGYWLTQTQLMLCHIGLGHLTQLDDMATQIGQWGASQGSFSYALGLGILLNRAARFWLTVKGDYQRSLAASQAAEFLFDSLGADLNRIQTVVDQARVNQAIGTYSTAVPLYEKALDELQAILTRRPQMTAVIRQRNISLAYAVSQLYQQSMNPTGMQRCAERVRAQVEAMPGGSTSAAVINTTEGVANWGLVNLAKSFIQQAEVLVPLYRGVDLCNGGHLAEAQIYFDQALGAARGIAGNQQNFLEATVQATRKNYDAAATAFGRFQSQEAGNSGFIGTMLSAMSKADSGREAQQQQRRNHEQALSFYIRIKKYELALPHFQQLQRLGDETWWGNDDQYWLYLSDCGELHEGLNDLQTALSYYQRAMEMLESRRSQLGQDEFKTAFSGNSGAQYLYFGAARTALQLAAIAQQQANLQGEQQALAQAFQYTEQGKGRALLDLMQSATAPAMGADTNLSNRWRELNARLSLRQGLLAQDYNQSTPDQERIAELTQLIQADQQALQTVETQLAVANPAFYQAISPMAEVATLDTIAARLPADSALLQVYYVGDDLLVWAITPDGMVHYQRRAIDHLQIDQWVRQVVTACANRRSASKSMQQLANLFLEPLADTLRQIQRLYIVPYGATHAFPFHALPFNGQLLGLSHGISYLPSASALQFVRPDTPLDRPQALVIGNPTGMAHYSERTRQTEQLRSLAGAELEAKYIASLDPDNTLLLNDDATEAAVREVLNQYRVIHFATHGILDEEAPLLSSVLLANGEQLTVSELMGLRLEADLVVLSACDTARGQTTKGDDVLGLSRGLLAAGAKAVLVSLWPVADEATTLLMGEFFRQIYRHDLSPARALQAAQIYLRQLSQEEVLQAIGHLRQTLPDNNDHNFHNFNLSRKLDLVSDQDLAPGADSPEDIPNGYSHPFYWAPFILIG